MNMNRRIFLTSVRAVFPRRSFCTKLYKNIQRFTKIDTKRDDFILIPTSNKWHRNALNRWMSTDGPDFESDSKTSLGKLKQMMAIQFTCKVCDRRNSKTFTKLAYTKGIVIIECDGCKNNHLIADNLGWFKHVQGRNIEEILAEKGEEVKKQIEEGAFDIDSQINFSNENK